MVNELIVSGSGQHIELYDMEPSNMIKQAASIAGVLADVIEKQNLFTMIQGKKYVRVDAWATLGTMLGVLPREVETKECANGDYESTVELYNVRSGAIVGRGSALCGIDEKRWANADRYARRSMAITRATGKAYRLGFAWVMGLAGYEGTPAEEIPENGFYAPEKSGQTRAGQIKTSNPRTSKAHAPHQSTDGSSDAKSGYDPDNAVMAEALGRELERRKVLPEFHMKISEAMRGKSSAFIDQAIANALIADAF